MRNVHTKYKWLAKDASDRVFAYEYEPDLGTDDWILPRVDSVCKYFPKLTMLSDWESSLIEIDHFMDVPDRFKYIFMSSGGLKVASVTLPMIFKSGNGNCMWGTTYESITIGNTGEPCNDWKDSLIERPSAKESSVEPTDLELMTIERDSYKSENNALKSEITILEGKLKQADAENRHSKLRFKDISELSQQINGLSK